MSKAYLLCFGLLFNAVSSIAQQATPKEAFLEKWQNSRDYLIAIAEAMPAERYNFQPTERQMDFEAQLLHIRANMLWLGNTYFTAIPFDRNSLTQNLPEGKAAIIQELTSSFDAVYRFVEQADDSTLTATVSFFAGPKSKLQILNLLHDHVTHHRGQLIVYLNLNAIEPPRYSGW